ncbi:MAG: hypothetical protein N0C90_18295 [Candidatus Thiodiazotropha endolucinida]|nr:hypothetical protein [Candidatus Thiodiazotropha taylori]MCW4263307.1 hypothetical protein [Candidatus Thiodiazotropha endolucinida]
MKLKDFHKFLIENPVPEFKSQKQRTLIVVGDSKGCRLQNIVRNIEPENSIVWKCKGGRTSFQAADYIIHNIKHFVEVYGDIIIAVWTGTCDLTGFQSRSCRYTNHKTFSYKQRKYIDLSNVTVDDVITQYQRIVSVCQSYDSKVKLVFLECPQYSICIWNKTKGDPNYENFKENTEILNERVNALDYSIRQLNETLGLNAPKFGIDLMTSRKSNPSYKSSKVSYSLLSDGIHPDVVLSEYWLRKIVLCICTKCYY